MSIKVGDSVRISCKNSTYNEVSGSVFEIQEVSRYAIVLLPEGTEKRLEGIQQNRIRAQRKISELSNPIPKGDPQWFPMEWLEIRQPD